MAGIPSAGSAGFAPSWLTRALVRIGMLIGLVVAGWLVGTASAAAAEDSGTPGTVFSSDAEAAPATVLNGVPVVGTVVADAVPTVSHTLSNALPTLALPAPQQGTELDRGLDAVLSPAVGAPAQSTADPVAPAPAGQPAPAAGQAPPMPTSPAPATAPRPAPAAQHAPASPVAPSSDAGAPQRAAGTALHPAAPVQPLKSIPTPGDTSQSCPPSGSGTGATTHSAHFVTLDDQHASASQAVAQRPSYRAADGVPSWHTQRPTTSPD